MGSQDVELFGFQTFEAREPSRDRTCDLRIKSPQLYQLSYGLGRGGFVPRVFRVSKGSGEGIV